LYKKYIDAKAAADNSLSYIRSCGRYKLTGKGDINTYAIFAELAHSIVSPTGSVGLLVPTGIATEHTTKDFFGNLVKNNSLIALYDFENMAPIFPDVHHSYKFCILLFGGSKTKYNSSDFVFFAHTMEDIKAKHRHIDLSATDLELLNPNTKTCPIFRSERDANITKFIYKRVPVLWNRTRKQGGNPWGIKFFTMFHQTNDAELFYTAEQLKAERFKREGANWKKRKQVFLPLYEAKMFRHYDHRFGSVYTDPKNWINQGQTIETIPVEHQNPEFMVQPRWWAESSDVIGKLPIPPKKCFIAFRDITRVTDNRTMIASFIPYSGVLNTAPLIITGDNISDREECCLLGNMNSFTFDFVTRQKVGHIHLNFYIVEQLPVLAPDFYSQKCPWSKNQTLENWISDRVLKLTCTSNDMIPLAKAAGFKPPVHKWNEAERMDLMAQLDAAYFLLYGIEENDVEYILSTFQGLRNESPDLLAGSTTTERIIDYYNDFKSSTGSKHKK
jgi:hypothetical protein